MADSVHIEELRLHVEGLTAEEGRQLGELVARKVGDLLRAIPVTSLAAVSLRVKVPPEADRTRLVEIVAAKIAEGLR